MSVGNLKDQGNKGTNFPYQLRTLQLLDAINNSINALPGVDYETRTTTYEATGSGPGYAAGNIIVRYDIINVATSTLSTVMWFNQTTQTVITPAPVPTNLTPITPPLPAGASTEATLLDIYNNTYSKMNRIKGADNYTRAFTYLGSGDVDTITHTGTTLLGPETIVETFSYIGGNVSQIVYS